MLTTRKIGAAARLIVAGIAALAIVAGGLIAAPAAFAGVDNYPSKWKSQPRDSMFDDWGMYNRECTSWVAWRLHANNKFDIPFHANADKWGPRAKALGYTVNTTPAVGAVAWWDTMHVAWVEAVNPDKTITIEEYNIGGKGRYDEAIIPASRPTGYIHFRDLATSFADGAYISYLGNVYRMAGGAPIYVSSWAEWGKKPVGLATAKQWNALRVTPADGTFLLTGTSKKIYRIVGGAPVYISSWDVVGGKKPSVIVKDTTVASSGKDGRFRHLGFYPAGTPYVVASPSNQIYKIDAGIAIPVTDWASVGGEQPYVTIGDDDIEKAGSALTDPYAHLRGIMTPVIPTISGLAKSGHTLKAVTGVWAPTGVKFAYQWLRGGVPIKGATAATYKLNPHNVGHGITVQVTATKSNYRSEVVISARTARVAR